jgi:hypothetical protein
MKIFKYKYYENVAGNSLHLYSSSFTSKIFSCKDPRISPKPRNILFYKATDRGTM